MSQLLLGATVLALILVGIVSADIMGFSLWGSNKFPVEGRVG
jgi:3-dehydrosphinganine reductase